jgi:hypothetical protein
MIFGRMNNMGREFVLIGLNVENLREIAFGKPLVIGPVPGDPTLANVQLIILAGENDEQVMKALDKLSEPPTQPPAPTEL